MQGGREGRRTHVGKTPLLDVYIVWKEGRRYEAHHGFPVGTHQLRPLDPRSVLPRRRRARLHRLLPNSAGAVAQGVLLLQVNGRLLHDVQQQQV